MYGLLPSQVRDNATVYDIVVTEALSTWEAKTAEELRTGMPAAPDLTQDEMKAMLAKARGAK